MDFPDRILLLLGQRSSIFVVIGLIDGRIIWLKRRLLWFNLGF